MDKDLMKFIATCLGCLLIGFGAGWIVFDKKCSEATVYEKPVYLTADSVRLSIANDSLKGIIWLYMDSVDGSKNRIKNLQYEKTKMLAKFKTDTFNKSDVIEWLQWYESTIASDSIN